jgi:hypothetical protein
MIYEVFYYGMLPRLKTHKKKVKKFAECLKEVCGLAG